MTFHDHLKNNVPGHSIPFIKEKKKEEASKEGRVGEKKKEEEEKGEEK